MFSQTTEYALRVMVYLASLDGPTPTIPQIATATQTPPGYLAKILRNLARANLVRSQRGLHGGSSLARPAEEITILEVVQAVDPIQRITTCPLGLKGHGVNLCPLHRRLDEAIASVERAFGETTLAEVVAEPTKSKPLCDVPTEPGTGLVPARVLHGVKSKPAAAGKKTPRRARSK